MDFQIATWNVNSLKVRLSQVIRWLQNHPVDVLCLQETKLIDENFPVAALQEIGYQVIFTGQKTYNGVAILAKQEMTNIVKNIPEFEDQQQRVIAATIADIRVICAYVPNGQSIDSEKYIYKLNWLAKFEEWITTQLLLYPKLIIVGDYNIAPEDRDVHNPAAWEGDVLVSSQERAAFNRLIHLGLQDAFRLFDQPEKIFSWWNYQRLGFPLNKGLRIDHILLSSALAKDCYECVIDKEPRKWEQPSDHTPVIAKLRW